MWVISVFNFSFVIGLLIELFFNSDPPKVIPGAFFDFLLLSGLIFSNIKCYGNFLTPLVLFFKIVATSYIGVYLRTEKELTDKFLFFKGLNLDPFSGTSSLSIN